ncbi:MAG: hypothetical protein JNM75_12680 [Rhodospirillales bacterium]|nr:hypothetical protein [Rhodospirillales bacterium]
MIDLICDLLEQPEPVIARGAALWTARHGDVERLRKLDALKPSDSVRTIACPACDEHHYVRVEYTQEGTFRAYCYYEGFHPIDADDLTALEVDIPWMIGALREGINVLSRPVAEELVPGHLWFLGEQRIRAYRTRFYFGWRLIDPACIEQAGAALADKPATMPSLLLTSSSSPRLFARLPKRHAAVFLPDACRMTDAGVAVDEDVLLAALRADDRVVAGTGGVGYVFSEGVRSAVVGDRSFTFTKKQAAIIEALYEAYASGLHGLHQDEAAAKANSNQRIVQIFRDNKEAYEALIGSDDQGYYWLKL